MIYWRRFIIRQYNGVTVLYFNHSKKRARPWALAVFSTAVAFSMTGAACASTTAGSAGGLELRGDLVMQVAQSLGEKPDPTGTSPYSDVPTSSPLWGYVHRAIQMQWVQPVSPSYFGAEAIVNESFATRFAMNLLQVKVSGASSIAAFARTAGLFPHYEASMPLSSADAAHLVKVVSAYETGAAKLPGSSGATSGGGSADSSGATITPAQKAELAAALKFEANAPFEQLRATTSSQASFVYSKSHTRNPQTESAMQQLLEAFAITSTFSDTIQRVHGKLTAFSTETVQDYNSSLNLRIIEVKVFILDDQSYVNIGGGWVKNSLPTSALQPLAASEARLTLLGTTTARTTGGATVFSGTLNGTGIRNIFQKTFASAVKSHVAEEQVQMLLSLMKANFAITVQMQHGRPIATGMNVSFTMKIPPAMLFGSADSAVKSTLVHNVTDITLHVTAGSTVTYNHIPVTAPAHLPIPSLRTL